MCLGRVYPKEKKNNIIKKLTKKGGWITVWKVVKKNLLSDCLLFQFVPGVNKSPRRGVLTVKQVNYIPYFHSYCSRKGAQAWGVDEDEKIIKCRVRPSWITAIGNQDGYDVIVSRKIVIPGKV